MKAKRQIFSIIHYAMNWVSSANNCFLYESLQHLIYNEEETFLRDHASKSEMLRGSHLQYKEGMRKKFQNFHE